MIEYWKEIKGFEGLYEVSSIGRVKSLRRLKTRTHSFYVDEKILNPLNKIGYDNVVLYKKGKINPVSIHRLVASAFIDNPENKKQVNHKNGIRNDNRVENLEWCTSSENCQHAYDTKLRQLPIGALNHRSKVIINIETGVFFYSMKEAANSANMSYDAFRWMMNNNISTPFRYAV